VLGVFVVLASQSFGALTFAGHFAPGAPDAIRSALLAAAAGGALVLWRNGGSGLLAMPQDRTAPILATMAAQVIAALPPDAPAEARLATALAAIATTTILTGAGLWLLGRFRLGDLIRYIPFPVVAGFLAGSGWLLLAGAIRVMTGAAGEIGDAALLFEAATAQKWLPGFAFGVVTFALVSRTRRPAFLPLILAVAVAGFWVVEIGLGQSIEDLRRAGWLAAEGSGGGRLPGFWRGATSGSVAWSALPALGPLVGTVLLTSAISILLNASAIEIALRKDIDYNRELRASGIANLAAGFGGAMVSFQSLNLSRLAHELGARTRIAGAVCAGVCALAWLAGPAPMAWVPKFVLGGLLCFLALGLLKEWLADARRRLPLSDYMVVVLIVVVVATLGFVLGVLVGIIAAVVLFVHNYSRVDVITHALDGTEQRSNVERHPQEVQWLRERGGHAYVLRLQGYLFFGTANRLLDQLRARAEASDLPRLLIVVLDLRHVSGMDTSAAFSLAKVQVLAEKAGFKVALAGASQGLRDRMGTLPRAGRAGFELFDDLDLAMEWCEEQLLAEEAGEDAGARRRPLDPFRSLWPSERGLERFLASLERVELDAGRQLIREGEPSDSLYFIESGHVSTVIATGKGQRRLQRQAPGTVIGELGFLLGVRRTASVWTETPCVLHRLTREGLERLKREAPEVVAEFFETLGHLLAERIVTSTRLIRRLSE
jgi:SulP family sulfate permease